jgi:MSHA biogenesis protein MshO
MPIRMTKFQSGFTLVEAVIVIAITGIISAVVAVFIKAPVQGYFDASRRAEMTDVADTALRRISRDLRRALPNSVRVAGGNTAIEFLQTRAGGRYRSERCATTAENDILDFNNPTDTTFELLGPPITFNSGDQIVIYNLGIDGANAYQGNTGANHVMRALDNVAGVGTTTTVRIISNKSFPFDSPSHSFQVVDTPVSYLCNSGTLTRYAGYPISYLQPALPIDFPAGTGARLANNANCTFTYVAGVTERSGLVSMQLSITQGGETVTLYHQVHVSNVP